MYRVLLLLLATFLTTFAINASVEVPPALIQNYSIADYNASGQNWDLTISPEGVLYVANNSGLLTFDGNTWATHSLPDESIVRHVTLSHDTVFTESETSVGYWLPEEEGDLVYHPLDTLPEHVQFEEALDGLAIPLSEEIIEQKPSAFTFIDQFNFVGTLANGIYVTDQNGESLLHISTRVGLQDNIVHDLYVERTGYIWAAFDNGLSRIIFNSPLRLLATRSRVGKLQDVVFENGMMYFKTNTNYYKRNLETGVFASPVDEREALSYLNKKEKKVTGKDITKENIHFEILYDSSDNVYQVSDSVYWFTKGNEAKLISLADGRETLKCRILFDNFHMTLVYGDDQIFPLNDSLHVASTMQGVVLINTNSVIRNMQALKQPLQFTRIAYEDKSGIHHLDAGLKEISLPHNYYKAGIQAGSSVFNLNNQISYKLEDVLVEWSKWQRDGKIEIFNLPPGEYELSVRRHVPIGDYPIITLKLEVLPPWYKTTWATLGFFILTWIVLFIGVKTHLSKQKRKEENFRAIERQEEQQKIQKMKNEMLEAELQNKKNELMIQTSTLIEKGLIINKLIEELDNQKKELGDKCPDKMYKRMRTLLEGHVNNQRDWITFENYFNSAHQNFIERFRQEYPDITKGDMRMCCLLRMNLTTKEIASLMNISIRGVELRRYRLKKRIGLDSDTNLVDFLMNF